jgi:hypothetical protein
MVAANLFDHPVILIVIAAVTLLRWIAQRAKTEKDNSDSAPPPPPPSQPIPRGGESQTEEERIRRFLEALGQPRGTTPPAPVAPRRREVLQRRINPLLPPLTTVPPPMPQSPVMTRPPPLPKEEIIQGVTELPIETRAAGSAVKGLSLNLGSAQDLRSAIVLREIFGPPRSLQPIDSIIGS